MSFKEASSRMRVPRRIAMTPVRPTALATLLRRRAVAASSGLDDLESMLRERILGSLPTQLGSAAGDCAPPRVEPAVKIITMAPRKPVVAAPQRIDGMQRGWGSENDSTPANAGARTPAGQPDRARGLSLFSD